MKQDSLKMLATLCLQFLLPAQEVTSNFREKKYCSIIRKNHMYRLMKRKPQSKMLATPLTDK